MNKLKKDGYKMIWLRKIAARGEWGFTTDLECLPPSSVMKPLKKAGLVRQERRIFGWNYKRCTKWFLTKKGRKALNG